MRHFWVIFKQFDISYFFVLYPTTFTFFVLTFRNGGKNWSMKNWSVCIFFCLHFLLLPNFQRAAFPHFSPQKTAGAFEKKILQCLSKAEDQEAFSASLHFKDAMIMHSVWKSQKKSHSTLRAKRATFTFWVDKSSLKMPKNGHFWRVFRKLKVCGQIVKVKNS